jgi:hypothetical protein
MQAGTTEVSDDSKIVSLTAKLLAREAEREQVSAHRELIGALHQITAKAVSEMREHGADSAQIARVLQVTLEAFQEPHLEKN